MNNETLTRVETFIRNDIRVQLKGKQVTKQSRRDSTLKFAKYLVSVATHSIGVSASLRPFNVKQGYVLLYIMEVFKLDEVDLKNIFTVGKITSSPTVTSVQKNLLRCNKFHSWRPEVVLRMSCPRQLDQNQIDNLSVRVYLFREDLETKTNTSDLNKLSSHVEKSKQILDMIFSKSRLDPSILIRPVNELRSLIKFKSISVNLVEEGTNSTDTFQSIKKFTMGCSYKNVTVLDDLRIPIRRYYCDPKTPYILRFEFWIDTRGTGRRCVRCIKSTFRAAVYNGICNCIRKTDSIYMNEHSDFYGFINLDIPQLPSYPIRKKFNILSMQKKEVDNCEIIVDIRNRQILDSSGLPVIHSDNQMRKSNNDFLVKHIRLYVNCFLYHCLVLCNHVMQPPIQEVTLDTLFYLPAHCLINQNRLQGNLSPFEDRCLRRISIILLLINIHDYNHLNEANLKKTRIVCRYLIAVVQNEYLIAHRPLDDKTAQDIHLFERSSGNRKHLKKRDICELEMIILGSFLGKFLKPRVTTWLTQLRSSQQDVENSLTLNGMRLLQSSLSHLNKCRTGRTFDKSLKIKSRLLKKDFELYLCSALLEHFGLRIQKIISIERDRKHEHKDSMWLYLLLDIKFINHNLCLNWSSKGLDGIFRRGPVEVDTSSFFKNLRGLKSVIQVKLDEYLNTFY